LVNLINRIPEHRYRHAIVCLTESTSFRDRIRNQSVPVISLHKREGKDIGLYYRLWHALRSLRVDIVHTRNLPTLECLAVAALAGVPTRIHGEHGRDVYDIDGTKFKYRLLRRFIDPLAQHYTAVSADLAAWLSQTVGIPANKITQVYNGVDAQRFHPKVRSRPSLLPDGFCPQDTLVVGTVGRMQTVKDQITLVRAFLHLLHTDPGCRRRLRLVIVGGGPLREESQRLLRAAKTESCAWLPGERGDIPEIMRALDLFVLPSLAEGISNTILEAMATGLPVIATRVGGNPELVQDGQTGVLVPPADPIAMAEAIHNYLADPNQLTRHGQAGRKRVEAQFTMEAMVNGYMAVYDEVLKDRRR
jgi:sugar transferase (PEP-CTERM/EpsH1 system associated)